MDLLHQYLLMFLVGSWPEGPMGGFVATLMLAGAGLLLSFPIAIALGLCRVGSIRWLKTISTVWVYVFRGIPLLLIIYWSYFLLPVWTGLSVSPFVTALCAIVVYESAFLTEIVRAGIEGIPRGQYEASRSVGLSYWGTMWHVILPQALVNMIPSLVNQFVSTIKATSIVYVIGVQELTFAAQQVNSIEVTRSLQTFLILAGFYFVACFALSRMARLLESRIVRKRLQAI